MYCGKKCATGNDGYWTPKPCQVGEGCEHSPDYKDGLPDSDTLKYIKNEQMDFGTLADWYIASVHEDDTPVWTEEHIEELLKDFYVLPRSTGES